MIMMLFLLLLREIFYITNSVSYLVIQTKKSYLWAAHISQVWNDLDYLCSSGQISVPMNKSFKKECKGKYTIFSFLFHLYLKKKVTIYNLENQNVRVSVKHRKRKEFVKVIIICF